MKKLILIRHAKSSWKEKISDHERDLKSRGITDAGLVASKFAEKKMSPDKIISSTATRTKNTADIFLEKLKIDSNLLQLHKELYDFVGEELIEVIKNTDAKTNTLMVFCHNFAITNFVNNFGDQYIENVPTSGLVIIDFYIESWNYIKKGQTSLIIFPRDLRP